jgi:two-component system phosphate regulon sensor histidine kinase PhoR
MIALNRIWKLYVIYMILLVVGVALAGFVLEAQLEKSLTKHVAENALTLARVIARSLPDRSEPAVLNAFCKSFRSAAGARITVISKEGRVIGESDADTTIDETRLDRPEVQEALRKGEGSSTRFSQTTKSRMLYAALFVKEKGQILRLALPMTKVGTFQNEVMILMSLALFLAPVFAIILTFFFIRYRIYEEDKSKRGKEGKYSRPMRSEMTES